MEDDIEMLSMTAKEAARQVAAHCAERARVILKIIIVLYASRLLVHKEIIWASSHSLTGLEQEQQRTAIAVPCHANAFWSLVKKDAMMHAGAFKTSWCAC
eukprot:1160623-Pelagomonas_calceolata.AAC.8